jgi:alkylation response protein AidB-like acyl-CoA dehydrogenase
MNLAFDEAQEELRSQARAFLAEHSGPDRVRAAMASEQGFDAGVWKRLSAELGWTALLVPEAHGGLGLGPVELVALAEVMGEALLCAPFLSSACLGTQALLVAGSAAQKGRHLPPIAEGAALATVAAQEPNGRFDAAGIETLARRAGDGFVLSGRKRYVLDGHCADLLVVPARRAGSAGEEGVSLFLVPGRAPGLERRALPTLDGTRRLADLLLHDVAVPADALLGEEGRGWPALERTLDLGALALAAEQVGGAQRCLDLSVAYAKQRVQFGRPIGSFQAIQHKCADMMVAVEAARSGVYWAACVAAEGGADPSVAASLAKCTASEAFFRCAAESLQIHGGVGFTWEYDVHLYLKRARAGRSLLGDPAWHRERVARHLGLPA